MTTPIERNELNNANLLQMEYFSDIEVSKKEIIIIEPNDAIAITIRKFLTDLGFEKIYTCKEMKEAIEIFSHLISNDVNVPIIIGSGTNRNIKRDITQILEMQSNANITIITTKEKTDPQISKLYDIGVSAILHKPLMFEDLRKSFSHIINNIKENKILENTEGNNIKENKILENTESTLLSYNKITDNKIRDFHNTEQSEIEEIIKSSIQNQRIILDKEILEAACNQCGSTNITNSSECPNCHGINFEQKDLIEHYGCGEIYPKKMDYKVCPKCNKQIGSVGKDYREFTDYHICSSCSEKFPIPLRKFICFECGNNFLDRLASWKKSRLYKIQK